MNELDRFLSDHDTLSRRFLLRLGIAGPALAAMNRTLFAADQHSPQLAAAIAKLEPYFTSPDKFRDVSRGKPLPHSLSDDKKREVGLTRETWQLEVVSDPE